MKPVVIVYIFFIVIFNLSAQYQDIVVTRDLDPNAKYDSYSEWRVKNPLRQTHFNEENRNILNQRNEGFLIIVNSDLYDSIEQSLVVYQQDLIAEGFNTFVLEFDGSTIEDMKQQIILYYQTENIVNAVLIGDLPVAWFELLDDWNGNGIQDNEEEWVEFPCDLYFTDVDGNWDDTDENEVFDLHEGDVHPEIGMGRIVTNNLDMLNISESELINNYFQRNHLFRTGLILSNDTSLAYVDDDWAIMGNLFKQSMEQAYSSVELVNGREDTIADDYLTNRLVSNYELIQVHAHSGPNSHYFYYNSGNEYQRIYNYDIVPNIPTAHFYNLFACSNSRFTVSNNMGSLYLYGNEHGLATIGSTKAGGMLSFALFYQPFSDDKTIGESLRLWWENRVDSGHNQTWERAWFYGMIIQGDPSLKRYYEPVPDISISPLELNESLFYSETCTQFLTIENNGSCVLLWDLQILDNPSWLTGNNSTGAISPSSLENIEFLFDSTALIEGNYSANLRITSDDPDEPEIIIPVNLSVSAGLQPPVNLTFEIEPQEIIISWDSDPEANSYIVYASDHPYENFSQISSDQSEFQFNGNRVRWSHINAESTKFYYVKASTDQYMK